MSTTGSLSQKTCCSKRQPPRDAGRKEGSWRGAGSGAPVSPHHKVPEGQWHHPPGCALSEEECFFTKRKATQKKEAGSQTPSRYNN